MPDSAASGDGPFGIWMPTAVGERLTAGKETQIGAPSPESLTLRVCREITLRLMFGVRAVPAPRILVKSPKIQAMRQLAELAVQGQFRKQVDIRTDVSTEKVRLSQIRHPDQAEMLMRQLDIRNERQETLGRIGIDQVQNITLRAALFLGVVFVFRCFCFFFLFLVEHMLQIGLKDHIIQTRHLDETAYYFDENLPFIVLYRVDDVVANEYITLQSRN